MPRLLGVEIPAKKKLAFSLRYIVGSGPQRADVLFAASLLTVIGVAYNRMNVVLFAMTFRGRMPWGAPETYSPSVVEWGVSIGLIAATIFLFGLAARLMPVLPADERRSPVVVHL